MMFIKFSIPDKIGTWPIFIKFGKYVCQCQSYGTHVFKKTGMALCQCQKDWHVFIKLCKFVLQICVANLSCHLVFNKMARHNLIKVVSTVLLKLWLAPSY